MIIILMMRRYNEHFFPLAYPRIGFTSVTSGVYRRGSKELIIINVCFYKNYMMNVQNNITLQK